MVEMDKSFKRNDLSFIIKTIIDAAGGVILRDDDIPAFENQESVEEWGETEVDGDSYFQMIADEAGEDFCETADFSELRFYILRVYYRVNSFGAVDFMIDGFADDGCYYRACHGRTVNPEDLMDFLEIYPSVLVQDFGKISELTYPVMFIFGKLYEIAPADCKVEGFVSCQSTLVRSVISAAGYGADCKVRILEK